MTRYSIVSTKFFFYLSFKKIRNNNLVLMGSMQLVSNTCNHAWIQGSFLNTWNPNCIMFYNLIKPVALIIACYVMLEKHIFSDSVTLWWFLLNISKRLVVFWFGVHSFMFVNGWVQCHLQYFVTSELLWDLSSLLSVKNTSLVNNPAGKYLLIDKRWHQMCCNALLVRRQYIH